MLPLVLAVLIPAIAIFPPNKTCHASNNIAAVMEVADTAQKLTLDTGWEWGGLLYRVKSGNICASIPVTAHDQTKFAIFTDLPKDAILVGMYHTHTGLTINSHRFSGTDALNMCLQNVTSFVISGDGVVLQLVPNDAICGTFINEWYDGAWVGELKLIP